MKTKLIYMILVFTMLFTACNKVGNPKEHLEKIYSLALESAMESDQALNSDMKFIAIDMSNFKEINNEDKETILSFLEEKYKVETMDTTLKQLEEKGYYNPETTELNGVLLEIEKTEFKNNRKVSLNVSKTRSGDGAVGLEIIVYYKNNEWKVEESEVLWES